MLEIVKFEKIIIPNFLGYFRNEFKNERELELTKNILKDCNNKKSFIYLLKMDKKEVGFVAISFDRIAESPVLSIEYLFVAKSYRKEIIVFNKRISEILIGFIIEEVIPKIKQYAPIRYLTLYPDQQNETLIRYYLKLIPNSFKYKEKEIFIFVKV
jgi:hypothetical protein